MLNNRFFSLVKSRTILICTVVYLTMLSLFSSCNENANNPKISRDLSNTITFVPNDGKVKLLGPNPASDLNLTRPGLGVAAVWYDDTLFITGSDGSDAIAIRCIVKDGLLGDYAITYNPSQGQVRNQFIYSSPGLIANTNSDNQYICNLSIKSLDTARKQMSGRFFASGRWAGTTLLVNDAIIKNLSYNRRFAPVINTADSIGLTIDSSRLWTALFPAVRADIRNDSLFLEAGPVSGKENGRSLLINTPLLAGVNGVYPINITPSNFRGTLAFWATAEEVNTLLISPGLQITGKMIISGYDLQSKKAKIAINFLQKTSSSKASVYGSGVRINLQ
jgi:hypothetical protein